MGSSNRLQLAAVREVTPGTTPATPRMRKVRITGESLSFAPDFVDSDELRDDRQIGAPIEVMQAASGGISAELSYPEDNSPESDQWRSTFQNVWNNLNVRDNDGTADSVITGVATTNEVLTVLTGTAFVPKELYKFSGFGVAGNNGVFKVSTGSATVPRFIGAGLTDEAVPPAAAKVQNVGFIGDAGDLNVVADGITSTTTDFTTFPGLVVGKRVKIGGTGAGNRFVTEANNGWARVAAIAAGKLTLEDLPTGWSAETGTGLTVKIWFGDYIRNGVTPTSVTLEKGFLDQSVPTYIAFRGMQVNNHSLEIRSRQKVTRSLDYLGMSGAQGTVALDASPDAVTTGLSFAANANVGRVAEGNATLTSPNWGQSVTMRFANNLRTLESVDQASPVGIQSGDFVAAGEINTYFGSNSILTKLYNATSTSLGSLLTKNSQALVFYYPTVYLRGGGNPQAGGKNQDVMANFQWQAADSTGRGWMAQLERVPYFEA